MTLVYMNFQEHIDNAVLNTHKTLGCVIKTYNDFNNANTQIRLITTLVCPILDYGAIN